MDDEQRIEIDEQWLEILRLQTAASRTSRMMVRRLSFVADVEEYHQLVEQMLRELGVPDIARAVLLAVKQGAPILPDVVNLPDLLRLNPDERALVEMLLAGDIEQDIADELGVTLSSAEGMVKNLKAKLKARNQSFAVFLPRLYLAWLELNRFSDS